jgi:phosphoribosylformimino-5-aminoimidazole carboxamide ribotide isomerase
MDIVPVLDIRDGIVVHARRGERASYAPLRSGLLAGSEPVAVLEAMLEAVASAGLQSPAAYVADLDAIVAGKAQWALLDKLRRASPVPLWVDAGFGDAAAAMAAAAHGCVPVIGSETLTTLDGLADALSGLAQARWILSLDHDAQGPRDPAGVLQRPGLWPRDVIAMDLTRVGNSAGGVGTWLETCMGMAADRAWIAAGGVRDRGDLGSLRAAGASAVLVATALHTGALHR